MIYLDNNATTRPSEEVIGAMLPFLKHDWANPSSAYSFSANARNAVSEARDYVASLLGADSPSEIVFTSGGTESDNWAIRGALEAASAPGRVVTTAVEHEAVRNLCDILEAAGHEVTRLQVNADGLLDLDELRTSVRDNTTIVSIMLANNETGVLFPVEEAARIVKERSNALFHVDAVNAAGKVPISVSGSGIDLLSISAHKFHGPKGIGALYIREGTRIPSFSIGGGQEMARRAGTEAVHQIAGLGAAARLAADLTPMNAVRAMRERFESAALDTIPSVTVNGHPDTRLPNTSNLSFEGANGELLLASLNDAGICVSTGSACNEGSKRISPVLQAMGIPFERANGSIRFSFGRQNTPEEVEHVISVLPEIVGRVRGLAAGRN